MTSVAKSRKQLLKTIAQQEALLRELTGEHQQLMLLLTVLAYREGGLVVAESDIINLPQGPQWKMFMAQRKNQDVSIVYREEVK